MATKTIGSGSERDGIRPRVQGNKAALNADFTRTLRSAGRFRGPVNTSRHGVVHDLQRLFAVSITSLYLVGVAVTAYAAREGTEGGRVVAGPPLG